MTHSVWVQAAQAAALPDTVAVAVARRAATDPEVGTALAGRTHPFPAAGLAVLAAQPATIPLWVAQPNVTVPDLMAATDRWQTLPSRTLVRIVDAVTDRVDPPRVHREDPRTGWTGEAAQPFLAWLLAHRPTIRVLLAAAPLALAGSATSTRWLTALLNSGSAAAAGGRTTSSTPDPVHQHMMTVAGSPGHDPAALTGLLDAVVARPETPVTGRIGRIVQHLPVGHPLERSQVEAILQLLATDLPDLPDPRDRGPVGARLVVLHTAPDQRHLLADAISRLRPLVGEPFNLTERLVWTVDPPALARIDGTGLPRPPSPPFHRGREVRNDAAAAVLGQIGTVTDDIEAGWAIWQSLPASTSVADRLAAIACVASPAT